MCKRAIGFLGVALTFGLAGTTSAHHPPQMDHCASFSFTGEIERIEWHAPHVELYIRTDAGETHHLSWLALNQLALADVDRNTLNVGDRVEVTAGILLDDTTARPMLLSYIYRDSDGWGWSQRPQGC
jgi:hypothetical protein